MSNSIFSDIAKIRRDMPRNQIVMRICDALEAELTLPSQQELNVASAIVAKHKAECKFDKTAYQRDYMRKKRQAEKTSATA